jgi:hypothetical protein
MKIHYVLLTFVLVLTCNANPSFAGNVTIPNIFESRTKAMASEVNANFKAIETEVNDNDSRIAALEGERSYTVFSIGEALHYLQESGVATELMNLTQDAYTFTLERFNLGLSSAEEVCQKSKCLLDTAYLAASDDEGRLDALKDHANRMESLFAIVTTMIDVGLLPPRTLLMVEYYLLSAETLVDGFSAKTGQ